MDSCKESKLRAQSEEERNLIKQKVILQEKEISELKTAKQNIEEFCRKLEGEQVASKFNFEEQMNNFKELRAVCEKHLAKIEDLKKEIESEKKLAEEWQSRALKSESQKPNQDSAEVFFLILLNKIIEISFSK